MRIEQELMAKDMEKEVKFDKKFKNDRQVTKG